MSDIKNNTGVEIQNMIKLAQNKSAAGRAELFNGITDLIESQHQQISSTEIDLMIDILGKIITEIEIIGGVFIHANE